MNNEATTAGGAQTLAARQAAPPAKQLSLWHRIPAPYYSATLITVILIVAEWQYHILGGSGYQRMLLSLFVAVATEIVLSKLLRGKMPNFASAYISGNSVTILTKPLEIVMWPFALGSFISIASKYVLALRGRHLWNPTNFGVSIMVLLAPSTVAVLGHQWSNTWAATGIIYAVGCVVCTRARVLHITATYLIAFVLLTLLRCGFDVDTFKREVSPLGGTMYSLFVFFMVTDPRTIISGRWPQVFVCVLVAVADNLIRYLGDQNVAWIQPFLPAPALFALFFVGPIALFWSILAGRETPRTGRTA